MEGPVRTCVACRTRRQKAVLVRLVVDRGTVTADWSGRRPGRGAYVCPDERCVEALLDRAGRRLGRALRISPATVRVDGEALRTAARRARDQEATTAASRAQTAVAARGAWM